MKKDWHWVDSSTFSTNTQKDSSSISNWTPWSWWNSPTLIGVTSTSSHQYPPIDCKSMRFSSCSKNSWWPVSNDKKATVFILLSCWASFSGDCTRENSIKDRPPWSQLLSSAPCWVTSSSTRSILKTLPRPSLTAFKREKSKTVEIKSDSICGDKFF